MKTPRNSYGNFDLVKQVKLNYTEVDVAKWKSRITGLTVVHVDFESEVVVMSLYGFS